MANTTIDRLIHFLTGAGMALSLYDIVTGLVTQL